MTTKTENDGLETMKKDLANAFEEDDATAESAPSSPMDLHLKQTSSTAMTTPTSSGALSPYSIDRNFGSPESDGVSADSAESECLMYPNHILHEKPLGGTRTVWVDESQGEMPRPFIQDICQRSLCLIVRRRTEDGHVLNDTGSFGQAAFIMGHNGVRRFVTAKHCLRQKVTVTNNVTEIHSVSKIQCFRSENIDRIIPYARFPADENYQVNEAGKHPLRGTVSWKHGIDIALGTELTVEALGVKFLAGIEKKFLPSPDGGHFSMVREDFILREGQIVGIVVFNRYEVTTSSNAFLRSDYKGDTDIDDEKLHVVYGPAGSMAIYCGKISYVGEHHIEYGLNSSNGCSGAAAFLLDVPNQHPSVREEDHGKAVASHAGFHPELGTNIGFKLTNLLG